ncbi:MAG: DUF1080 domain-containing protein [Planctomycetaceae bacterium]
MLPRHCISRFSLRLAACFAVALSLTAVADDDSEEDFEPLFNGKDLTGWEGNFDLWKVENECIVGDSPGIEHNQFLATKEKFGDFELRLEFRLKEGTGNTGIQFRSSRIKDSTEVSGYQADVGEKYWGCLYDESRRRKVLVQAPEKLYDVLDKEGWNTYVIRAEGDRVQLSINGFKTVDYIEKDADIPRDGIIALQVHSGPPLKIEFRNIRIKLL